MGRAKDIVVKVIPAKVANPFVMAHHYSGKVVQNSQLHFGCFLDGRLHGVMSFGPSMSKEKIIGLVEGTKWNEFIELNRMAFDDYLPSNSESRCIGLALRMIRKQAPHIKWVISFADGTQCGDGTIYRASNFLLTGITTNHAILRLPNGDKIARLTIDSHPELPAVLKASAMCGLDVTKKHPISSYLKGGAEFIEGYMLRYIYFIDPAYKERLTVPILPFSEIDKVGAGLYKGEKVTQQERHEKVH